MEGYITDLDYSNLDDEYLVARAKEGDRLAEEFIIKRYKNLVSIKSTPYYLKGADDDDVKQEGMIGLCKAIRDFDPEKSGSFRNFANLCITRQIISAVKAYTRQKHGPLNSYVSLNKPFYSDEFSDCKTLVDSLVSLDVKNPEELIIVNEEYYLIKKSLSDTLSELELEVLHLYLDGNSYVEIGEKLNKHAKSIDNALQRVKKKMEKHKSILD